MTKYNRNKQPLVYAIFSFLLQLCAAAYVILSLTDLDGSPSIFDLDWTLFFQNIALAAGSFLYGFMVALPEVRSTKEVYRCLYRSDTSPLALMDFIVNALLPISVAIFGLFVVREGCFYPQYIILSCLMVVCMAKQTNSLPSLFVFQVLQGDSFIDGVLNVVALLFIIEIDDQLPRLLELDAMDIVQGFLIDQAMEEYETQDLDTTIPEIEFSDMHITNTKESGSVPSKGVTFQPYEVFGEVMEPDEQGNLVTKTGSLSGRPRGRHLSRKKSQHRFRLREGDMGLQVANKRYVTKDCLLRKVEWQYTGGFDYSTRPRIGHLRLTKLDNVKSIIDVQGKQCDDSKPWFSVTGVYIITGFSMSDDILRLRICGSETATDFLKAFRYYSLWPLEKPATALLKKTHVVCTEEEKTMNNKVLRGYYPEFGYAADAGPDIEGLGEETQTKSVSVPAAVIEESCDEGDGEEFATPRRSKLAPKDAEEEEEIAVAPAGEWVSTNAAMLLNINDDQDEDEIAVVPANDWATQKDAGPLEEDRKNDQTVSPAVAEPVVVCLPKNACEIDNGMAFPQA
jgi:hypothetical protein